MFEQRMAALEGAEAARATATGMAAVTTALMGLVRAGDHVVAAKALFGSCRWVIEEWLPRFGVTSTLVDGTDLDAWKKAVQQEHQGVLHGDADQSDAGSLRHRRGRRDRARCRRQARGRQRVRHAAVSEPAELGADCVVYSATKHIDGQGRVLGGVILASEKFIMDHVHQIIRQTGPSLSPFNAWVLLKGLETLPVRVAAADRNRRRRRRRARRPQEDQPADLSRAAPTIRRPTSIAKQMKAGSTLCSFEVKGGKDGAFRFLNALKLIGITNNLGDAKSLITHPTTTTHQRLTPEQRAELGIGDGLVRFSAGLEHPDDVIEDLLTALDARLAKPASTDVVSAEGSGRSTGRCAASAIACAETLGQAGIAPVVHVQPVGRHERRRTPCGRRRASAASRRSGGTDRRSPLRGGGDQLDHARGFRLGDHLRRELRIDQHDVGARRADLVRGPRGSTRR